MTELSPKQEKLKRQVTSPFKFGLFLLTQLPMGLVAGMRLRELDENKCVTSVPFKWLTKNPFKSIYFAVQSMAAELSTATPCLLAIEGHKPSIAFIIVDLKATFGKKATDRVYFTCEDGAKAFDAVEKAIATGESQMATFKTVGKMKDGTIVSEFEFTWSFKQRSKKS
ncbi:MAG: thioesterase [Flammeovirgaceae bacterium]|nr:thioesterase [Flammeovirgaceae bacterium]MBR06728.1 thioesterase [Rickettsiales bacterium]|tara:strand:- start:931 stop:1434 length:504 start_codon:yes stop_codon:yes gene_type:complete